MNSDQEIDWLAGRYELTRSFNTSERFNGTASISHVATSGEGRGKRQIFDYLEEGQLILTPADGAAEQLFSATRRYRLVIEDRRLAIYFGDRQQETDALYQSMMLRERRGLVCGHARHWCDPDIYESFYVAAPDRLRITHRVSGPRKNYLSISRLVRR